MKTVIVPVNGNPSSIDNYFVVRHTFPGELIHYIFLDVWAVPDNYNDLITTVNRSGRACVTKECCEAVARFSEAGRECTAAVDHIYGDSVPVFRNYCEHHGADLVIFDQSQWMAHPHFHQHDIFRMVMRSGKEVLYLPASERVANATSFRMENVQAKSRRPLEVSAFEPANGGMSVYKNNPSSVPGQASTMSVYRSVDQMLSELEKKSPGEEILIRQVSRLGRYFMKQTTIQRMLSESNRDLLWLRK